MCPVGSLVLQSVQASLNCAHDMSAFRFESAKDQTVSELVNIDSHQCNWKSKYWLLLKNCLSLSWIIVSLPCCKIFGDWVNIVCDTVCICMVGDLEQERLFVALRSVCVSSSEGNSYEMPSSESLPQTLNAVFVLPTDPRVSDMFLNCCHWSKGHLGVNNNANLSSDQSLQQKRSQELYKRGEIGVWKGLER